ncbi:hypothetical protein V9K67_18725 [Paraflavisolibacter sp. H34]|uniref:hypothetical protein n=1 Tax=Huijunlia imazamoxiresistens TaxID=3127457 RepID=UPI003017D07D
MKKIRPVTLLLLFLLLSCASFAAGAEQTAPVCREYVLSVFHEEAQPLFSPVGDLLAGHHLSDDHSKKFSLNSRFKKKQKSKYLLQQLNLGQYLRKSSCRFLVLYDGTEIRTLDFFRNLDAWLIRPGYYAFLFRLSPF